MRPLTLISISAMTLLAALAIPRRVAAQEQQDNHHPRHEPELIEFDAPGASTSPGLGTQALANNNFGAVVGFYTDANVVSHGFLRVPSGKIISLDAPGAGSQPGSGQGTAAYSINDLGEIAGASKTTITSFTDSCAPPAAPSSLSTLRAPAQDLCLHRIAFLFVARARQR